MRTHRRIHRTAIGLTAAFSLAAPVAVNVLPSAQAGPRTPAATSAMTAVTAEGTNVGLASAGATVTASGQEVAGQWGPNDAIDGNTSTRWSSDTSDSAWITVKLPRATAIDHVAISWERACAAQYKLQVSNDGATFTDATDVIAPTCSTRDTRTLTKVAAGSTYQYVRMQGLDRTPIDGVDYGMSLFEFEVWNGSEPAKVTNVLDQLVPKPLQSSLTTGSPYALTSASRIVADASFGTASAALAGALRPATGFPLTVTTGTPTAADIALVKGTVSGQSSPQAYSLTASSTGARITASTDQGAFYGVQTLRQLLPAFANSASTVNADWRIPALSITDAPRLPNRGVQLDVARSFLNPAEVKKVIDMMATVKLNELHMHLSDDQGWRIEITNDGKEAGDPIDYTLLHRVSGSTAMTQYSTGVSGYYTQVQFRDLVAYAAARQITIVPEIDAPAHTNAILHAIPQMNTANTQPRPDPNTGTVPANGTGDVGYSTLDVNAPMTWTFMRHVFGQIAAMAPDSPLHIGGDESHVTPHDDYQLFVTKMRETVHALGRRSVGWNESATAGVEADDVIQFWYGDTASTVDAANNRGAKVLASPGQQAYVDQKYNAKTPIGLTWLGAGDVPRYYNWDPAAMIGVADSQLWGVEAPLWSETIRGGSQAEFMVFPRATATAEVGWTPQSMRNWDSFATRLGNLGTRMLVSGTNFYDSPTVPWNPASAGVAASASSGADATLTVGRLSAPGTKATSSTAIATDTVDDTDGPSWTTITGSLTATIDWGDGSTSPASFTAAAARDNLHAGSQYTVSGTHTYASPGTRAGTITYSNGMVSTFTVSVS